jgi:hypothetical protein
MNESKVSLSRATMYAHLGAQYCSNIASQASAGNYIVGELHTKRNMLTREQIAARCRKQRLEAGLPVYDAPRIRSREAQPPRRDSLLRQATAMASRLWNTAETLLHAVTPRIPGAAASALGRKGTGNTPDPIERATLPLASIDRFAELAESLGLHASYSHQFVRLDASEPDSRASWMVTPSFDPATQAVDDLLVFLESTQPGNLQQADQLKMMLSYLFERGMRTFTASPDVLEGFPCSTEANCVPVQSICDGKVLLDTVLAAAGKGNVVILPPEAIESLASMLSPAYVNATEDFVWVSAPRMRALEPQYRINCTIQPSNTGPASPQHKPSCGGNEGHSLITGFVFGVSAGALVGAALTAFILLCRNGANVTASVTQFVPREIGNKNKEEENAEAEDDKNYRMKHMNNERSENKVDMECSQLEPISSSVEND